MTNLDDLIKADDILIDCGANVGQETLPALEAGAEVYSFEPNPYAFKELLTKAYLHPKAHLYPAAVLDTNSEMNLYLHQNNDEDPVTWSTGSSLMSSKRNVNQENFVTVPVIDLISFISRFDKQVKVLKLDVEGAEYIILKALIQSGVYKKIDHILVETHDGKIPELDGEKEALDKLILEHGVTNIDRTWK